VSPVSSTSTPYNRIPGVNGQEMDRKQPESSPVQEALRPTHLSMRRELNCNRGSPKIPKRASPKFMIPSKIGLSCSVFASRFQQYAPQDSRRNLDIPSSVACRTIPRRPQRSVKCIPCPLSSSARACPKPLPYYRCAGRKHKCVCPARFPGATE
jgi:hypothetical protein